MRNECKNVTEKEKHGHFIAKKELSTFVIDKVFHGQVMNGCLQKKNTRVVTEYEEMDRHDSQQI